MSSAGIIVVPHNPAWAAEFASTRARLERILEDVPIITIEHFGSTSIPDLYAKPIIDIDIEVTEDNVAAATMALVNAGYRSMGDGGIPSRYAFFEPGSGARGVPLNGKLRRNTYVVVEGSLSLRNHRDLKRILSEDAELRKEYGDVKKALVRDEWVQTVEDYCSGKNEVICKILRKAGWTQEELDVVTKSNLYARGMMDF